MVTKMHGGYVYKIGENRSLWYPSKASAEAAAHRTQRILTIGRDKFLTPVR